MNTKLLTIVAAIALQSNVYASNYATGNSEFLNYDWFNKIVNLTPTSNESCPTLEMDTYSNGFKVALQKSFYVSLGASASKWFPENSQWASVGVSPTVNNFGVLFADVDNEDQINEAKNRELPRTAQVLENWRVSDSAYWESQGGVALYVGTGVDPLNVGVFAVATGGWTNFLQKTGPNKVYVERAKKNIKSVSFGAGISYPNISIEKVAEDAAGFAYEFTLESNESIEAFERFMAGDNTKAQELEKFSDRGVLKISNTAETRLGISRSFGVATPFLPILSFKTSVENSYDQSSENTVWDEGTYKDVGMYIKQRSSSLFGQHFKLSRSFTGGQNVLDLPGKDNAGRNITKKTFGTFKYSYMSDWGQELRLRKYIAKAKSLTGLTSETCVKVPESSNSLAFNQVNLELNLSNEYIRAIMNSDKSENNLLDKIKKSALHFQATKDLVGACEELKADQGPDIDDTCNKSSNSLIEKSFEKLNTYAANMSATVDTDKKEFAKNITKFGEEIWKSPFIFKAFFEKGKDCGQEFNFEVSGRRISRHVVSQKWAKTDACSN